MNKMTKKDKKKMGGQVVLMVLLASALVLTLGLSASKQATVETKIDTDQELLKKAFNTAESGIEYYLGTGATGVAAYKSENNEETANVSVKTVGDSESLSFDNMILNGELDYFWLVKHNNDGSLSELNEDYYSRQADVLNICTVGGENATFKINYYYKSGLNYKVKSSVVTTSSGCVSNFNLRVNGLTVDSLLLSVMPVGSNNKIKLTGSVKFPVQGEEISSTGLVQGVNNTVTVLNKYVIPTFLLEAVTSGGDVTNQ